MNPTILIILVAPLVGAWIEIAPPIIENVFKCVAPLVGAWIEILLQVICRKEKPRSLLSWERGLK